MNKKLSLANEFIKEAWEQFQRYEKTGNELNLRQACEKAWATVAQALKVVNPQIKTHRDFGETAAALAKKYNNPEITYGEAFGEALHRSGFYEGDLGPGIVRQGLECIENFLKLIDNILNQKDKDRV
jgi:hypothetical protein